MAGVRKMAAGLHNVVLPGWINASQMAAAISLSQVGLAAYADDALQSLPNKVFEYMAGGLAVVSSLRGEVERLLAEHDCGVSYRAGDAESLAAQLAELAADPVRRRRLQANAHALWEREFGCRQLCDQFADHLHHIAESHRQLVRAAA